MLSLASIPSPSINVFELGPLTIHVYGITFAIGFLVGVTVMQKRLGHLAPPNVLERMLLITVGASVLGARLGYVLPRLGTFADRPLSVLYVWEGGLAFYGGLTLGTIAMIWQVRKHGLPLLAVADAAALAIPLGQGIGRWGNYFNQELFGTPTDLPWGLEIDPENRPAAYADAPTFHPTFLYEFLGNLVIVGVLWWVDRRFRPRRGTLFGGYLVGYGLLRFLMELLRTDTSFRVLGLSRNAWVSLLIVAVGIGWLRWISSRPPAAEPDEDADTPAADAEATDPAEDDVAEAAVVEGRAAEEPDARDD